MYVERISRNSELLGEDVCFGVYGKILVSKLHNYLLDGSAAGLESGAESEGQVVISADGAGDVGPVVLGAGDAAGDGAGVVLLSADGGGEEGDLPGDLIVGGEEGLELGGPDAAEVAGVLGGGGGGEAEEGEGKPINMYISYCYALIFVCNVKTIK